MGLRTDTEGDFRTHIRWWFSGTWIINCYFHPGILGSQYMTQGTRGINPEVQPLLTPGWGWHGMKGRLHSLSLTTHMHI